MISELHKSIPYRSVSLLTKICDLGAKISSFRVTFFFSRSQEHAITRVGFCRSSQRLTEKLSVLVFEHSVFPSYRDLSKATILMKPICFNPRFFCETQLSDHYPFSILSCSEPFLITMLVRLPGNLF